MLAAPRRIRSAPKKRDGVAAPPLLENGDRLPAAEFLRRFEAMPDQKKAELINGVVYMPSPVRIHHHAKPDNLIQTWLGLYEARTPGTLAGANATVKLDADNVPQPDSLLMILPSHGGQAEIGKDGYVHGAPELVVEVAASSAGIDLHAKMDAYRRAGVREYLVWRTSDQRVDWFALEDDVFVPRPVEADGTIGSVIFPGLVLAVPALVALDSAGVLDRLAKGLNKGAHRAFVGRLAKRPPAPGGGRR